MSSAFSQVLKRHPRRLLWVILPVTLVVFAYVASYCVITHMRVNEALAEGRPAFFYVPADQYYESPSGRELHFRLSWVYAPLNWIHTSFFGGLPASRGGVEKLTGPPHPATVSDGSEGEPEAEQGRP